MEETLSPGGDRRRGRRSRRGGGRTAAAPALVLVLSLALGSCASSPPGSESPGEPVSGAPPVAARPPETAPPIQPPVPPSAPPSESARAGAVAPRPGPWLAGLLERFQTRPLPAGGEFALLSLPGRGIGALVIALEGGAGLQPRGKEGVEALALSLAAKGPARLGVGGFDALLRDSGARIELQALSFDAIGLVVSGPVERLLPCVEALAEALATPAFLEPGFPREAFEAVLRDLRVAERRSSADPETAAGEILRAAAAPGHPYAIPPLGREQSLARLGLEDARAFWRASAGAERVRIAAVAELPADALAAPFARALAVLGRKGSPPFRPAEIAVPALSLEAPRSAASVSVRAQFTAPPRAHPDFPALLVGLAMVEDLVNEELRGAGLAYGAWARLSWSRSASGSLVATGASGAAVARAAFLRAAATVASGRCLGPGDEGSLPAAPEIGRYAERAASRLYARSASAADLATRMARDLAAGGDGSAWFRMADRLAAVEAADVARVVRERLVEGGLAWVALGKGELVAGFAAAGAPAAGAP